MRREVSSRDNPLLQEVRRLARQPLGYRRTHRVWLEGEHLCAALRQAGHRPEVAVVSASFAGRPATERLLQEVADVVVVPDRLFAQLSELPSPAGLGFLYAPGPALPVDSGLSTLVLDRIQDAGNVGSLLRTAAAFGVQQVLALEGTAGLWSPKVLRAGMGAHFSLRLTEQMSEDSLLALGLPLVATSSHAAQDLTQAKWPPDVAWVLGHEGQGVSPRLQGACVATVRIPQPGVGESLNVAAAGAVCLYESLRRRLS